MKKILAALLCATMVLGITGCGASNDELEKEKNVEKISKDELNSKLSELRGWLVSDYWNDAVCDIQWYVTGGTSSVGGKLNPEITLKRYNKAYKKAPDYNKFINSLDEEVYGDVKESWNTMYEEMQKIDKYIQSNEIAAESDPSFNVDLFSQAKDYFYECLDELEK